MSQEPNTTSDTNPQPQGSGASPRFSFSPKKKAEEVPPAPVEQSEPPPSSPTSPPLKRPPPGTRLTSGEKAPTAAGGMPTPLTPVKPGATTTPFPQKSKGAARGQWFMRIALVVLLVVALGEAYVIFVVHDDNIVAENSQKPPLVVTSGPNGKPIEIVNDGAPPPTPAYAFLLNFNPQVASGSDPRIFFEAKTYHIGELVAADSGLKWTRLDDKTRELEFTDKQGRRYIKKF